MYSARESAVRIVNAVFSDGAYTNIILSKVLKQYEFVDIERKFLTELVYGTVKSCGTLDWYLSNFVNQSLSKLETLILADLRVAMYQLLFVERVPEASVVDEAVKLAKKLANPGAAGMVNGVLRNFLRKKNDIVLPKNEVDHLAILWWHPKEYIKKWLKHYGYDGTEKLCRFNNNPAPLCLRVNTLQTNRDALMNKLFRLGVTANKSDKCEDGIVCDKVPSLKVIFSNCPREFYIQDESSMLVAKMFAPKPGQKILDLCAAPGGKTTHLAQLMQNKGEILACDIYSHKLALIEMNAKILGINIIKTKLQDGEIFVDDFNNGFDGVLVDAPCSGLGVLRRRAEARWIKKRENLKTFPLLQRKILNNAERYVKKGGTLVYSTCTIEESENHYMIKNFLDEHPNFLLEEERQILPQNDGMDGFYMSKMIKKC